MSAPSRADVYFAIWRRMASVAALASSALSPDAIEALIKKTARDLGAAGRDTEYGFGLIQPRAALFGFGVAR